MSSGTSLGSFESGTGSGSEDHGGGSIAAVIAHDSRMENAASPASVARRSSRKSSSSFSGDLPAEEVANLRSTGGSVTDAAINSLGEELTHLNDTKKELENDIIETQEAQKKSSSALSQLERDNKKIELANRQMSDLLERQRKKLRVEPLKGVNDAAEKIPEKMSKYDIELEQLESSHREFKTGIKELESKLKLLQDVALREKMKEQKAAAAKAATKAPGDKTSEEVSQKRILTPKEVALQKDYRDLKKQMQWWKTRFAARDDTGANVAQQGGSKMAGLIGGMLRKRRASVVVADPKWESKVVGGDGGTGTSLWSTLASGGVSQGNVSGDVSQTTPAAPAGKPSKWALLKHSLVLNGAGATAARKIPKRASFIDVVRAAVAAGKAKQSRSNGVEISAEEKQKLNIGL